MTINTFNRLTGQVTLHPLVGIADLTDDFARGELMWDSAMAENGMQQAYEMGEGV